MPFEIKNFTLHYKYAIESPQSCAGIAIGHNATYECNWEKTIQVSDVKNTLNYVLSINYSLSNKRMQVRAILDHFISLL